MFTKSLSKASALDKAIAASVAAMLAMNVFVLTQQQVSPSLATAPVALSTGQA